MYTALILWSLLLIGFVSYFASIWQRGRRLAIRLTPLVVETDMKCSAQTLAS